MKQFLMTALLAGSLAALHRLQGRRRRQIAKLPLANPRRREDSRGGMARRARSHASVERFREAEQMGITLNYSRMGNVETALKCLDYAAETGIKLIVECDELYTERANASTP